MNQNLRGLNLFLLKFLGFVLLTTITWVNVNGQTPAKPFGSNTKYDYGTMQSHQSAAQSSQVSKDWYSYWVASFVKDCGGGKSLVVNDYGGSNAYSEGQGYGMLLAAYYGDKATFDKLLQGYLSSRNSHGLMNWTVSCSNTNVGSNGATDGDLDAAMGILIANKQWPNTSSPHNYASVATALINAIKTYEFVTCGGKIVQKAGDYLGGCNCTNPSYYATGYYRAFAKHVPGDAAFWTKAADDGLDLLLKATHPSTGLNPAWTDESGSITNGGTGDCNNIAAAGGGARNDYQFDAARTPWRMVVDYLWWGTPKAKQYLDKITAWANTKGINQIMAGHKLDGTAYLTYTNSSFVGGFAIGAMGTTNQTTVNNFYKYWIENSMHNQDYASGKKLDDKPYFQNSLRTMYHFVASGNFWNPYATTTNPTNQAPTVSITAPVNNASLTAPATISITANAADSDGTVSSVAFYNGTTLLSSDASSPYSYSWTNVAAGTYTITARATDNAGAVTTSSAVTVVVTTPTNPPPTVSISSPANNATFTAPASITINATAADANGTVSSVAFYNGTTLLGSDASSPYSYSWTNVAAGTYTITARATDNGGAITTSAAITVTVTKAVVPQGPYSGTPISIPGKVEAENYDVGGQSLAYNDASTTNEGTFRTDEAVDVEATTDAGGGYNVGWTETGEWLEYTVNVATSGMYNFNVRVASMATGSLHIEMGGTNVTGAIAVPSTGGYQTWQTVTASNINLTAGNNQVMRIYFDAGGMNLNYVEVTAVAANVAPTVSITSPSNNASFTAPASITINATAADTDGTVSNVQFYNGSTLLVSDNSSPYSYSWTNVAAGTYTITAKATDNSGAVTTSSAITVVVNPAPVNVAPTVSITSPANNASFTAPANIAITATAADSDGSVSNVQFYNGSTLIGSDNSIPYTFTLPNVPAGTYMITARATDNSGAVTISSVITVVVNPANVAPSVSITSPVNNTSFTAPASITISASAADTDGSVSNVEFFNGSTLLGSDNSSPYSYSWTNVAAGTYTITAKATDNSGAVTTSSAITVVVNPPANVAPTVSITSPANNASFTAPASITINATAADTDGTVSNVQFYNGSTLLGSDNSSPYSFSWTNVAAGTHTITARATDNSGAVTISSAITVVVTSAPNEVPTVSITSPANNATFTAPATINIEATASDADGTISSVQLLQGTTVLKNDITLPYSFSWTNVAAGTYTLTAIATDNSGGITTSSTITVVVNPPTANVAPTVSITSPANNASFTAPATINIEATASDVDGSISSVQLLNGTTVLKNDVTSPYSFSWTNVAAGTYTLTAVATDNSGATTTSSAITVVVEPSVPTTGLTIQAEDACSVDGTTNETNNDGFNGASYVNTNDEVGASASWAVNSSASQAISLAIRYAHATSAGRAMSLSVNGVTQVANIPFPSTDKLWISTDVQVNLSSGTNIIELVSLTNEGSPYIDELTFGSSTVTAGTCPNTNPNPNPNPVGCSQSAVPSASNWVVRNDWTDQYNGSGVSNSSDAMRVTQRAWGYRNLWVMETGNTMTIENGKTYTIQFEFQNDVDYPVNSIDIGFGTKENWNGPSLVQSSVNVSTSASSSYVTKTVTFTANSNATVFVAFKQNWSGQVTKEVITHVKNLSVCSSGQATQQTLSVLDYETAANPFNDQTTVKIIHDNTVQMQLVLLDASGLVMWESWSFTTNQDVYVGSGLPAGTYIVKAAFEGKVVTFRIVKN